jgi:hypothetical protein
MKELSYRVPPDVFQPLARGGRGRSGPRNDSSKSNGVKPLSSPGGLSVTLVTRAGIAVEMIAALG